MEDKRIYLFIGARYYALERMFKLKLNISGILVRDNSFAHKWCLNNNIECNTFNSKKELLTQIKEANFNILVSEGCPYILPVSELKKESQLFLNIHPGLLPEIRGASPVNASILFDKPQGVTCHIMDDGIDTGTVISRVLITDKPVIPIDLLYRLSFMAEADAFELAHQRDFKTINNEINDSIYYTRHEEDRIIDINRSFEEIKRQVKAFSLDNQYAYFVYNNTNYYVKDVEYFNIEFLDSYNLKEKDIVQIIGNNILVKEKQGYTYWHLLSADGLKAVI